MERALVAQRRALYALGLLATLGLSGTASAEDAAAPPPDEIVVYGRGTELVGQATSGSEGVVGYADIEKRPFSRVGELAENVPGLIATQHSGEGKANQYFLRGFNLDHGTDLAGSVDGAPINMRSHGHGQGYLDLNFLIPELVERIDYTKGPYRADKGDFASAGTLGFTTKSALLAPIAEVTAGTYGYHRALVAGSTPLGQTTLLAALDAALSDGPWVLDEKLQRFSGLAKVSGANWSLGLTGYASRWNATDQVPQRAITSGLIPRTGYIDPDLGGRSGRIGLTFNGTFGGTKVTAYAVGSRLQLTSNFTYFLDDPVRGDQFRQIDRRGIFGGSLVRAFGEGPVTWRLGAEARWDHIGQVGLYRTVAGEVASTVRADRVDEASGGLFGEASLRLSPHLRLVLGLRGDGIAYNVRSDNRANSGSGSAAILTPKAALAWQPAHGFELYANYGEGYHSNDVRGATITIDPTSGEPASKVPVFARSRGAELGARYESNVLTVSLVGYWLDLASELVFVGDVGTTEANAATRRFGTEASLFLRPAPWLAIDAAAAITHARFREVEPGQDRIPGAVPVVFGGGVAAQISRRVNLSVRLRHFGSAPLIEDGSVRSRPTTIVNTGAYWTLGHVRLGAEALNLFDTHAPDISYFYTSRLPGEPSTGVEDTHIHPVEPRQVRISVRLSF